MPTFLCKMCHEPYKASNRQDGLCPDCTAYTSLRDIDPYETGYASSPPEPIEPKPEPPKPKPQTKQPEPEADESAWTYANTHSAHQSSNSGKAPAKPEQFPLIALVPLCLVLSCTAVTWNGCESESKIQSARSRGYADGMNAGHKAGEADGFSNGYKAAHQEAYAATFREQYESYQYRRKLPYMFAAVIVAFVCGWSFQWSILYLLRFFKLITDIDAIILPSNLTELNLRSIGSFDAHLEQRTEQYRKLLPCVLALSVLCFGCRSQSESAYKEAFESTRSAEYQKGWEIGLQQGHTAGLKQGKTSAQRDTENGEAFDLYIGFIGWFFLVGILTGLLCQYAALYSSQANGYVSEFWTVAFVPAMRQSRAYGILEEQRRFALWWESEVAKIAAEKNIKLSRIEAVKQSVEARYRAITSLHEAGSQRLMELAKMELDRIIADAEQEAETAATLQASCPYCRQLVSYHHQNVGQAIVCPHQGCSGQFLLPAAAG